MFEELDAVADWGLLATDEQLNITGWNRWLEQKSGLTGDQVLNRSLFEVFPELLTRRFDRYYHQALSGQTVLLSQKLHRYIIPLPRNLQGSANKWMHQTGRIIPLVNQNSIRGTLTLVEDVTERVETEAELRSRADQLADAAQRKDEFLAMLAHELRNPLAPIRSGLQALLNHDIPASDAQRLMGMMSRQVSQMASLIDDLLDVSRITRGKVTLRKETVELAKIIAQSIEIVQPLIDARGHTLRTHLPITPLSIHVDGTRMVQILGNLLNNAAKYTDAGGQIDLTATREGDDVVIRIRDTGVGIPAEMLPRVFELFSQVDTTLHRSEGGLGIGLTLVRSLVELHAGSVHVTSPGVGHGSEFSVRIPIGSVETLKSNVGSNDSPADPSPRSILIVDDNVDAAESLALLLRLHKHHVWTAFEGITALELATNHKPELILLDIGLPKMDGYEVARQIRRADIKPALLIAMTGYGQEEDRRKSNEAGFDKHIVKPVDPQLLIQLVNVLPKQSIE